MYTQLTFGHDKIENEWGLVDIYDENGKPTNYVAVRRYLPSYKILDELLKTKKLVGLCAYENFPEVSKNPHDNEYMKSEENDILKKYGNKIILWCHCFKTPTQFIPPGTPLLLQSDSDHYRNRDNLMKKADTVEKKYDFFCSLPNGDWNYWIRGGDVAKKWLNYMADTMKLTILVGGGDKQEGFSDLIQFTGFLPWDKYTDAMNTCKYMFNASRYDASPRIVIEALSLNIPVLLNQDILGGWKYINSSTGSFFFYDEPIETAIKRFMNGSYKPKEWIHLNLSRERSMKLLANTLHTIVSRRYEEFVDGIVCINLLKNKEKHKTNIDFETIEIPSSLVHYIEEEALDVDCQYYRKSVYHVKALELAKEKKWGKFMIIESNFVFDLVKERVLYVLSQFYTHFPNWDVFMLTTFWKNFHNTELDFIKKIQNATTVSGYMVQSNYIDTLIENFKEAGCLRKEEFQQKRTIETSFAIDQRWATLQKRDNFYISVPYIGKFVN